MHINKWVDAVHVTYYLGNAIFIITMNEEKDYSYIGIKSLHNYLNKKDKPYINHKL